MNKQLDDKEENTKPDGYTVLPAVRVEVQWFASKMEEKLALNCHKTGWKDCEVDKLIDRMQEELDELKNAWWKRKNDWGRSAGEGFMFVATNEELIKECADVANFAMMVKEAGE